jgi:hypothetical protein
MGNVSPTAGQPGAQASGQANGMANAPASPEATASTEGQSFETGTPATAPVAPVESLMQWGALHLRARASYQFSYATGLHSEPGKSAGTYTHTFSPGLTVQVGPHVSLDYSPVFRFFSEKNFRDTVDQAVSLNAGVRVGDWTLGLAQSFTLTDEPTVETSAQTEQKSYFASLSASYQFNDKISFDTGASAGLQFVNGTNAVINTNSPVPFNAALTDSQNYSGSEWINYQFDESIDGGLGVTVGYSKQNNGFSSVSEQYLGRVTWRPGPKFTLGLNGGMEVQQFLNTGANDLMTPIFAASMSYHLFEQTTLSLSASRSVNTSLFQDQVSETTVLGLGVQQRLLGKLQLSLGFGYNVADYINTTTNLTTLRSDTGTSFSAGVTCPVWKHGTVGAFYQYSQNSSSQGAFAYSSKQAGASLSWSY